MEIRGTRKRLTDGINTPVRKWGYSSLELGVFLAVIVLLLLICFFLFGFILSFLIVGPVVFVFVRLSSYLKENQKKGIDKPIITYLEYSSVPKRIRQTKDYRSVYGSKRSN